MKKSITTKIEKMLSAMSSISSNEKDERNGSEDLKKSKEDQRRATLPLEFIRLML